MSLRDIAGRKMHHGDGVFLNPFSDIPKGRLSRVLKWKWFTKNQFKPYYAEERVTPVVLRDPRTAHATDLEITLIKHAGILIKDADAHILIDPIFNGLLWFIEDFSPLAFDAAEMPQPDHILITHGHYDHLDIPSLGTWGTGPHIVSPPGYDDLFDDMGMTNRTHLDWYEQHYANGRQFILIPCNHWTMRNPIVGPNTGLWGSYIIQTRSGATVYISGDTGYFDGFEQIGEEFDIDLAIFNLGAYEPRWFMAPSHMNPEETVKAFRELGARHLAIVHWGTFRLGDEPVHFPPLAIKEALNQQGLADAYLELEHGQAVAYA
jgi:L-ascorbate metabolism protein UlaG (beta-lactamase superfamily)